MSVNYMNQFLQTKFVTLFPLPPNMIMLRHLLLKMNLQLKKSQIDKQICLLHLHLFR